MQTFNCPRPNPWRGKGGREFGTEVEPRKKGEVRGRWFKI